MNILKQRSPLDAVRDAFAYWISEPENMEDANFRATAKAYAPLVVNGARLLREQVPQWTSEEKLNLSDLDLANGEQCVLGQLAAKSAITAAGFEMSVGRHNYIGATEAMEIAGEDFGFDLNDDLESSLPHPLEWVEDDGEERFGSRHSNESFWVLNHLWVIAIQLGRKGKKVTTKRLLKGLGLR